MSDSPYDAIAGLYDDWSRSVTEDVPFYVAEAAATGGPVVELAVGTGRIAIPIARRGIRVIGVDASREMLAVCRARARAQGVADLLDLRVGDLRSPPVAERVRLVTCPFRAYLHLRNEEDRRRALAAAYELLAP
ncbi:MAG: class I SAM-dependent methyltransferase, partial [Thermoleophilia bacterium]|nr:class I SAM-dependent methyltransferase [Thermoleophilia bacterium]